MSKVSLEVAANDLESWLDYKKIFPKTREQNADSIEFLQEMISEGVLMIDERTFEITHKLLFEIGEDEKIDHVVYKSRINDKILKPYMNGVKSTDADGRLTAYIAALTNQNKSIIQNMDSQDKKISTSIAVFFL
jgi:hypothetical protein